jgi:hypothetical protein
MTNVEKVLNKLVREANKAYRDAEKGATDDPSLEEGFGDGVFYAIRAIEVALRKDKIIS